MALETVDSTPVPLWDEPRCHPPRRHGAARCGRVLLAIAADRADGWRSRLMAAGHGVVTVHDLEAALDALADEAFDACLLDLDLPDALETAKLYCFLSLDDDRPVPIIGLAGWGAGGEARHGGALCGCVPRNGGASALAALRAMLPEAFRADPDQDTPARVVSLGAWRAARAP